MILTEFLESGSLDHFLKVPYLHLVFCMLGYVSLAIDKNNELVLDLAWRGFKNILLKNILEKLDPRPLRRQRVKRYRFFMFSHRTDRVS